MTVPHHDVKSSCCADKLRLSQTGTTEDIDKLARRQVKPTRQHNEECRRLLGLMGIPFLIVSLAFTDCSFLELTSILWCTVGPWRSRGAVCRIGSSRQSEHLL